MTLIDPAKIRNVAVVGHRGVGKTSLVEALLHTAGAKNRLGTVVDGTTTMDHDEDEIKRQMTISAGLAHLDWAQHKINLVDTPGEASFITEALGTLPVVEIALMAVNAVTKGPRFRPNGCGSVHGNGYLPDSRSEHDGSRARLFRRGVGCAKGPLWRRSGSYRSAHWRRGRLQGDC